MRHLFLVNPAAGKKRGALELLPAIHAAFAEDGGEYAVRITRAPGEAAALAREACAAGGPVRIYACGGDGTLLEAAEGCAGHPEAELAAVPCGSANDYIRTFGEAAAFRDIRAQIHGTAKRVDAIEGAGRLCLDIASMGMDAAVAAKMVRYKHLPLISGPMAYNLAVADVFCHKIGIDAEIHMETTDGPIERRGRYFFALAAAGRYYGGGYCGAPRAVVDDGLLDFVLIKAMPRLKIPAFLSRYKTGRHLDMACCEYFQGTRMQVRASTPVLCNMDGECRPLSGVSFCVRQNAFRLVLPKGITEASVSPPAFAL